MDAVSVARFDRLAHAHGMAHCYLCGSSLAGQKPRLRRRVPVGEWTRRVYGKGSGVAVVQKHGMRMVCARCAKRMEERRRREVAVGIAKSLIAMVILAAFLVIMNTR